MPRVLHVFSGPTLDAAEVRAVAPDAVVHPPVAAGDLSRLRAGSGDVVVIVDGAMTAGAAVRHKEILALVDAGVEVWGSGALGALRAAELQPFGMRVHGRVARLFLRGALEGDDEVAVATGERDPEALALVDLRATCRAACRAGVIDANAAAAVVAAAQTLAPARRSARRAAAGAVDAGLDPAAAAAFETFARSHPVRLTHDDALACLHVLRRRRGQPPRLRRGPKAAVTAFARTWSEAGAGAELPGGGFVGDLAVLTFCRLCAVDFPAFQRRVALRTLAALSAPEVRPGEREGQAMLREFAAAQGLDAGSLPAWLDQRGMRREELLAHLRRDSAVGLLLDTLGVHPSDERAIETALAEVVGEHARRRGFVAPGASPSWERSWLSASEMESLGAAERIARLASRSFHSMPGMGWRQPLLQELKVSGVFGVARDGVLQAREFVRGDSRPTAADDEVVGWFAARWDARERFDLALLDRGFSGLDIFLPRARPFHGFDRATTAYRELRCLLAPSIALAPS